MIAARLALLCSVALFVALCPASKAQTAGGPEDGHGPRPTPAEGAAADNAIVVTARRYGEARVAAEAEFDEAEIAGQGADSIGTLLDGLSPFIDPSGERPVVLINGRPADGDRAILSYPTEALNRLEILKPQASAQYGYPPERRVVNIVLKQHFSSFTTDGAASAATRGGQYGGDISVGRVAIDGPARWNVQARLALDSALLRSARNLPPREGRFDGIGIITGLGETEIDPALSLSVGRPITIAALPADAALRSPTPADFAATAGIAYAVDPDEFETLLPLRRILTFGAGMTRPVGDFSVSVGINASSSSTEGLRGLPMVSAVLPAASPWSPFSGDIVLTRPFAGLRPLRNDTSAKSLGMTLTASGRVSGWETALSVAYSRAWSENLLERGVDAAGLQARIDAGDPAFNPYGPLNASFLQTSSNRTRGDTLDARISAGKGIVTLPAGPLTMSFAASLSRSATTSEGSDGLAGSSARRQLVSAVVGVGLPVSRKGHGPLGDLSIELSAGGQLQTGSGLQTQFSGGMTWSPVPILQFRGSLEYSETSPSFDQLDGAVVSAINQVFDYARQETVNAIWITGGNPGLGRGRRDNRTIAVQVRPFADQRLTFNLGYREQVATGGVVPFPELTPAIEAAFPERVTRDSAGRLIAIDARPINLERDTDSDLKFGIALRLPKPRRPGPGAPRANLRGNPFQFSASINHRWRLKSEVLTRSGIPVIDQLGDDGGQSRHSLSFQVTAGKRGIGTTLSGIWSSETHLRNRAMPDGSGDLSFARPATFNLSVFAEPAQLRGGQGKPGWLNNVRLSLDVRNLFGSYRRVTRPDGSIPLNYSRDQVDPLGRTVRLSLRKRF